MALPRKSRAASLAARDRWPYICSREYLLGRDQQHGEPVVGAERREVLVPRLLDVEALTQERAQVVEMTAAHRGANTAVIVRLSKTGVPSSFPTASTSAARRSMRSRPRSGCSRSRPRKNTIVFTFDPALMK